MATNQRIERYAHRGRADIGIDDTFVRGVVARVCSGTLGDRTLGSR